ncbi:MAG: hypothetical protein Q9157_000094 [Trypethelium eluteriae]
MHEFQLTDNGTALMTAYDLLPWDLSAQGITSGIGYITSGVFQEINVTSGEVLFSWSSIDHVPISSSYVKPNSTDTSGNGLSVATPYDYFHINAIDKSTTTGNYLVSSRHTSTLYYISSSDGSIIWRLTSSSLSNFTLTNFNFSFQHDGRLISENSTHITLSIFDNASDGYNQTSSYSSGKFIAIDLLAGTATLTSSVSFPDSIVEGGLLVGSQGNTQLLSNSNIFNGWGPYAWATEHDSSGTHVVWAANFAQGVTMNYRAFSFDGWNSTPADSPAMWAYAKTADGSYPLYVYVSWNGATEVASWSFYGSMVAPNKAGYPNTVGDTAQVVLLGSVDKTGFETMFESPEMYPYVLAQAVDGKGTALRNSTWIQAFVPSEALTGACGNTSCNAAMQ